MSRSIAAPDAPVTPTIARWLNHSPVLPVVPESEVRGGFSPAQHGTRSKYVAGCRCDPCRDAEALYSRNRQRRRCPNGHPYTKANVHRDPKGVKRCRKCMRAKAARANAKRRQPREVVVPEHGTESRYRWKANPCRCAECRAAAASAERERRRRRKARAA